jgi:predicted heme/steroid binding protein
MNEIIDIHVHLDVPKCDESSLFLSEGSENGVAFLAFRLMTYDLFRNKYWTHERTHSQGHQASKNC